MLVKIDSNPVNPEEGSPRFYKYYVTSCEDNRKFKLWGQKMLYDIGAIIEVAPEDLTEETA